MVKNPKIPVLHILHSQSARLYNAVVREDKVYMRNNQLAQFSDKAVFTVVDETQRKKRKLNMVIVLDGKATASEIRTPREMKEKILSETKPERIEVVNAMLETLKGTTESIFEPLTDHDRRTVVKREIAKQLGKIKPMETWQFLVLIGLVSAALAVGLLTLLS